jgi:hypothetical protein
MHIEAWIKPEQELSLQRVLPLYKLNLHQSGATRVFVLGASVVVLFAALSSSKSLLQGVQSSRHSQIYHQHIKAWL